MFCFIQLIMLNVTLRLKGVAVFFLYLAELMTKASRAMPTLTVG